MACHSKTNISGVPTTPIWKSMEWATSFNTSSYDAVSNSTFRRLRRRRYTAEHHPQHCDGEAVDCKDENQSKRTRHVRRKS